MAHNSRCCKYPIYNIQVKSLPIYRSRSLYHNTNFFHGLHTIHILIEENQIRLHVALPLRAYSPVFEYKYNEDLWVILKTVIGMQRRAFSLFLFFVFNLLFVKLILNSRISDDHQAETSVVERRNEKNPIFIDIHIKRHIP